MTLLRTPYLSKRIPIVAVCPRCRAAYESALHRICEAEQRDEEEKAGWR
jgi:hypothetical protein